MAVVGVIGASVLLAGCASNPAGSEEFPFGTFAPSADSSGGGMAVDGPLTLRDGCLVLDGEPPLAVWFPSTATWDEATRTITVGENTYVVGEDVSLGGNIADAPTSGMPEACEGVEEVFMATGS